MPKTATFLFWHLYWGLENKRKSLFAKWLHYIILYCNLFWKRKKSPYNLFRFIWSLFGLWWTIKSRSWYTETGIRGHGIRYLHKLKITLLALNLSVLGILYEFISVKSLRNSYFIWHFSIFFQLVTPSNIILRTRFKQQRSKNLPWINYCNNSPVSFFFHKFFIW